jgi:hypothetical protein
MRCLFGKVWPQLREREQPASHFSGTQRAIFGYAPMLGPKPHRRGRKTKQHGAPGRGACPLYQIRKRRALLSL